MLKIMKNMVALFAAAFVCGSVMAEGIISFNFGSDLGNPPDGAEAFVGNENIGPLATESANWNSVLIKQGVGSGSMSALKDDDGNVTTAALSWSAKNAWKTSEVFANDQQRLSRGYLDDGDTGGGFGLSVVISNIPYAQYRVYGLLASDGSNGGNSYSTHDFQLNGSLWVFGGLAPTRVSAYGHATLNLARNGSYWSELSGSVAGNYWTQVAKGPTLTIRGKAGDNNGRGSLSGIIIEQISVPNTISLNLAEADNQDFSVGDGIGPLSTDSATWNSTIDRDFGELKSGSKTNLIDVFGASTGVSALWKAHNTWWNQVDGSGDDQHKLAVGYLDENASYPCSVTFSNIPYASYRVYGLLASDTPRYTARDFEINGMWARGGAEEVRRIANSSINTNYLTNGEWWTETAGSNVTGNYWTVITCGSNLTVQGQGEAVARGSLAGIVIEEVTDWYLPTNRTIGFSFKGDQATGLMPFNAVAGAPLLQQRYWGNLMGDFSGDSGVVPARCFDSFGALVGQGNTTNNGIRLEFDGPNFWHNASDTSVSPDHVLMSGYMDSNATLMAQPYIQIRNIPYQKFDIVVYVDGDDPAGGKCGAYWLEEATTEWQDDGADLTPLIFTKQIGTTDFDGTYTQVPLSSTSAEAAAAGNYIVFTGMTHSDITIRGMEKSGARVPINAFQIVDRSPPPPPVYPLGTVLIIR